MNESERNSENLSVYNKPESNERSRGEQFSIDLDRINSTIEAMLNDETVDPSTLKEAWAVRAVMTEEFIDSLELTPENPNKRERAQFDIMVDKAMIFEKVGNMLGCLRELDTAEGFAFNNYLDDVIDSLANEIDSKVGELDDSLEALVIKLRHHVSFENKEYLRDLIYDGIEADDFLGYVYDMILDEGGNPDEIIKSLCVVK